MGGVERVRGEKARGGRRRIKKRMKEREEDQNEENGRRILIKKKKKDTKKKRKMTSIHSYTKNKSVWLMLLPRSYLTLPECAPASILLLSPLGLP